MVIKIVGKIKNKNAITEQIQRIPEFSFSTIRDSIIFTNNNLRTDKATLIIYFNTDCNHCVYEAEQIGKNITKFKEFQIIMVSYENKEILKKFAYKYNLTGHNNLFVLQDKQMKFDDIFGISSIPTSFIYNKKGELIKQFIGEVKLQTLLKYLNK